MKALSAGFFAAGLLTGTWWVAGIGGVAFVALATRDGLAETFKSG